MHYLYEVHTCIMTAEARSKIETREDDASTLELLDIKRIPNFVSASALSMEFKPDGTLVAKIEVKRQCL